MMSFCRIIDILSCFLETCAAPVREQFFPIVFISPSFSGSTSAQCCRSRLPDRVPEVRSLRRTALRLRLVRKQDGRQPSDQPRRRLPPPHEILCKAYFVFHSTYLTFRCRISVLTKFGKYFSEISRTELLSNSVLQEQAFGAHTVRGGVCTRAGSKRASLHNPTASRNRPLQ